MKYSLFLQTILILSFFLTACTSPDDLRLEQALVFAGNNRGELEKVLSYYAGDSLKQAAARFLIMNMTGHTGYDPSIIPLLQPVYQKHVAISQKYDWKRPNDWRKEINELWNEERVKINLYKYPNIQDAQMVKADWLIKEINLAFKAWKENVYTKNAPFEEFCKYILPYRFSDKFCLDNNRKTFYDRHHGIFDDVSKDFREVTDSLHFLYSDIMNSAGYAASMPICNIAGYEQIKRGICNMQTQLNAHLMSAMGMAVAIDFVPMWGNRSEGHSWNALIVDGKTHPFEPFWDEDRWKYDKLYSNSDFIDLKASKFRLPKVFRKSYEYYLTGPMADKNEKPNNIPNLFKNPWIRDVSTEYFQTSDVTIDLSENIPENTCYCYLCVYNALKMTWHPVQWGKINKKKVIFKNMGRGIVYLPAFYQNGEVIPAAPPFILDKNDKCKQVTPNRHEKEEITVNTITPLSTGLTHTLVGAHWIGCYISGSEERKDTLCTLTDSIDSYCNCITFDTSRKYQKICLALPQKTIALSEITFYEKNENRPEEIPDIRVTANVSKDSVKELYKIVDGLSGTGFLGSFDKDTPKEKILTFDLGKETEITAISIIPKSGIQVDNRTNYTLYYWDNKWIEEKTVKGNGENITFKNIPSEALYLIKSDKPADPYFTERIFTYKNGRIYWW